MVLKNKFYYKYLSLYKFPFFHKINYIISKILLLFYKFKYNVLIKKRFLDFYNLSPSKWKFVLKNLFFGTVYFYTLYYLDYILILQGIDNLKIQKGY